MTQEDRRLLIKDLCGRSYYKVKVSAIYDDDKEYEGTLCAIYPEDNRIIIDNLNKPCHYPNQTCGGFIIDEHKVKPYLFPLSSMTEEQLEDLKNYTGLKWSHNTIELVDWEEGYKTLEFWMEEIPSYELIKVFDWLNKNHFDYRGLIEKGLAIDCTNLNIY